jgi:hypothetical protein
VRKKDLIIKQHLVLLPYIPAVIDALFIIWGLMRMASLAALDRTRIWTWE